MPRSRVKKSPASTNESIQENALTALRSTVESMQDLLVRVSAMADEGRNLKDLLAILDAVGKTSNRLSTLLKNQKAISGSGDLAEFLNEALADVVRDMGDSSPRPAGLSK